MAPKATPRGLLVTVGGQSEQIIFSLEQLQPDYVVFLTTSTPESEGEVDRIVAHLGLPPSRYRVLSTPDTPDAAAAMAENCRQGFHWLAYERKIAVKDISLDATGGRKWMSAAALMTGMALGLQMPYVDAATMEMAGSNGQKRRVPDPSTMRIVPLDRIYECANLPQLALGITHFNAADFHGAQLIFKTIHSGDLVMRSLAETLRDLAGLANQIDRFELFRTDLSLAADFDRLVANLSQLAQTRPYLSALRQTADRWAALKQVYGTPSPGEPRPELVAWLLLAAQRREQREQYDGAVLLYYRCLEMASQARLWQRGLCTDDPDWSLVPSPVLDQWRQRYPQAKKIGLVAGYVLLALWGDEEVKKLGRRDDNGLWRPHFESAIEGRNYMFSVHGFKPVGPEETQRIARYARHIAQVVTGKSEEEIAQAYAIPPLPELIGCPLVSEDD